MPTTLGVKPVTATIAQEDHDRSAHDQHGGDDYHSSAGTETEVQGHDHQHTRGPQPLGERRLEEKRLIDFIE